MPRVLLRLSALVPAIALSWALAMMYVAWEHNPQGRFHEEGVIRWGDWLMVGGVHFGAGLVAAASVWLTVAAACCIGRALRNRALSGSRR